MEYFLSINNERQGPFSLYKAGELIEAGSIDGTTLGWHRGLVEWIPVAEIPSLAALLPTVNKSGDDALAPASTGGPPPLPHPGPKTNWTDHDSATPRSSRHPFRRFAARMFDFTLVSSLVFMTSDFEFPQLQPGQSYEEFFNAYLQVMQQPEAITLARTQFFTLVCWHVLEAFCLHIFRTTPGKALLGISIGAADGSVLTIPRALGRSFYVYVMGVGFYSAPFILVGMIFSLIRLLTSGQAMWDQQLKIRVDCAPLGGVRIGIAVAAFVALFLLQSLSIA
jgi:GYF domain 2/RDD family